MKIAIAFAQIGPYHRSRINALREALDPHPLLALQVSKASRTYPWDNQPEALGKVITISEKLVEETSFTEVFREALAFWRNEEIGYALLPSYSPGYALALLLSARRAGVQCVMMNESHAGTETSRGWKRVVKRRLLRSFSSAIVGGTPQKNHFSELGMPAEKIFTGYDVVDNAYFIKQASAARDNSSELRHRFGLPERYLLSLGRMVPKKNLTCLIQAFAERRKRQPKDPLRLVMVGDGPDRSALLRLCRDLNLSVGASTDPPSSNSAADVHFHGFRQIGDLPVYYALADLFVLPSLREEWGLVVNEAMVCGLPVIVSNTAGSALDLVEPEKNGYRFDPSSPVDLANRIDAVVRDAETRQRMGHRSVEIIRNWGCDRFACQSIKALRAAGLPNPSPSPHTPSQRP